MTIHRKTFVGNTKVFRLESFAIYGNLTPIFGYIRTPTLYRDMPDLTPTLYGFMKCVKFTCTYIAT